MNAESTRKLIGDLFELQDLGAQDLKGSTGVGAAGEFGGKPVRGVRVRRPRGLRPFGTFALLFL
jgi:hypothetical protein